MQRGRKCSRNRKFVQEPARRDISAIVTAIAE